MKTYKLILAIFITMILMSCGANRTTVATNEINAMNAANSVNTRNIPIYDAEYYDYQYFDRFYTSNPFYFHNNVWYDNYGHIHYYYNHPHYIRYCRERGITPYRGRNNQNYYYKGRLVRQQPHNNIRHQKNTRVRDNRDNRNNNNVRRQNSDIRQRKSPTKRGG